MNMAAPGCSWRNMRRCLAECDRHELACTCMHMRESECFNVGQCFGGWDMVCLQ